MRKLESLHAHMCCTSMRRPVICSVRVTQRTARQSRLLNCGCPRCLSVTINSRQRRRWENRRVKRMTDWWRQFSARDCCNCSSRLQSNAQFTPLDPTRQNCRVSSRQAMQATCVDGSRRQSAGISNSLNSLPSTELYPIRYTTGIWSACYRLMTRRGGRAVRIIRLKIFWTCPEFRFFSQ